MKRVYIDLDGVLCNISKQIKTFNKLLPKQPYPQSQYGFFMDMEPIKNSINSVKKLMECYDVWILTAPSWQNPMCLAEKNYWVRKHFGIKFTEKIIISSDKSLLIGDYLIDDNLSGRGQDRFTGELIHFGGVKFKTWDIVLDYLIKPISFNNKDAKFIEKDIKTNLNIFELGIEKWYEDFNGNIIHAFRNNKQLF